MFTGEQTQKMDTKGRTVIPSKIRDNHGKLYRKSLVVYHLPTKR